MRKTGKKLATILLAATMITGLLTGCGEKATGNKAPTPTTKVEQQAEATKAPEPTKEAEATKAPEPTKEAEATKTPEPTKAPESEKDTLSTYLKELNAIEVTELMGNGINLGNTMEAYGRSSHGINAATSSYETFWGMPVTTQKMVDGMKAAGFDTLRVPVAWTNMMNYEDGDYTINQAYLDRVGEIIDYAIDADMFVIVNDHWDGGWWGMFGSATEVTRNAAMEMYVEMWTQIATEYADKSYKLIFESANEELGNRLNDTDVCPDSGAIKDPNQWYPVMNQINQTFVDTVRACGGNNSDRFLLIAGANTNIADTCDSRFQMPTDTVEGKLLVSVHYYDPSNYCIFTSVDSWGSKQEYQYMNDTLAMLTKFTEAGYGVVIGEWGVLFEHGTEKQNRTAYMDNYLDNCDIYGYCPVLWDCSNLYNRNQCKVMDEYTNYFADRSYETQAASGKDFKAEAQTRIAAALEAAPEAEKLAEDEAVAWIMYTSSDWATSYSVGDVYTPDSATAGVVATDAVVTGAGTYTVALDFTGTGSGFANGVTFCAVGIGNGEQLFPKYVMHITEIKINGEVIEMSGLPYTTSDDNVCTRVNIYNEWVTSVPGGGRTMMGAAGSYCTPCPVAKEAFGNVKTIEITFNYVAK